MTTGMDPAMDPGMDPAERAWRALRALVHDQYDTKAEVSAALGMSFLRVKAIGLLSGSALSLRTLATRLICDPPYATVIVDDLVSRGLAVRSPNPADGRSRLVTLTPAGHRAAAEADRILGTPPPAFAALDPADLATLSEILSRITGQ
ncbi:MarR family transcriptional regulator [Actinoplanes sp. NPDC051851]|uniref:MarR family winged helix-turn-helix transcriptional regulator n=1 Tax=Actinoplanes sp. NPDC051851 TaxID=3154753 RepID=UPI00342BBB3B